MHSLPPSTGPEQRRPDEAFPVGDDATHAPAIDSDAFSRRVVDDAPVIILILDLEGRILHFNPFFERLTGYRLEEVRGRAWFDTFLPERERERTRARFRRSVAGEHVKGLVNQIVVRSGEERTIEWTDGFIRDEQGEATGILAIGQDVTALAQAELRLREAQQIARLGNWELDLATSKLVWSEEVYRIFEVDPAQFAASYETFLATIHPDDRSAVDTAYRSSVEQRIPYEIIHRLLMPDGRVKWVRERGQTEHDADGRPLRSVGTVHDITEIKCAEDAARRPSEMLRAVIRGAPVVMFALDKQGVVRLSEGRALQQLGLQPGQIVGASAREHFRDDTGFAEAFHRALAGEHGALTSWVGPTAFEAVYAPSYDASGAIDGVIVVGFDVTDRLAAEAGMRDREARLAAVFNHSSDAMSLYEVDTDGTLRLVAVNRAALERFRRVKEADVLGLTFGEIALEFYKRSPESFVHYQGLLRRVIDTRTTLTFEDEAGTRDGMIYVEATIVPILDDTGRCAQVLWSSRDVTVERKAAERTRASLAEKETLLREIHHRVKNNLQVISGLLHFQGKKLTAPTDVAAFAELRQRIFAMTLLHERLYRSPDVGSVAFGDYVRELVAELGRSFAPRQDIRIDVCADDLRLPLELAMPTGMIISELVTNVLKYAFPEGHRGTATVSVQRVGDGVVVGVDDDGLGFPHGFTADDGTSFGWELVRLLVLQINGTVEATTDRGAHVRVAFQLPSKGCRS